MKYYQTGSGYCYQQSTGGSITRISLANYVKKNRQNQRGGTRQLGRGQSGICPNCNVFKKAENPNKKGDYFDYCCKTCGKTPGTHGTNKHYFDTSRQGTFKCFKAGQATGNICLGCKKFNKGSGNYCCYTCSQNPGFHGKSSHAFATFGDGCPLGGAVSALSATSQPPNLWFAITPQVKQLLGQLRLYQSMTNAEKNQIFNLLSPSQKTFFRNKLAHKLKGMNYLPNENFDELFRHFMVEALGLRVRANIINFKTYKIKANHPSSINLNEILTFSLNILKPYKTGRLQRFKDLVAHGSNRNDMTAVAIIEAMGGVFQWD